MKKLATVIATVALIGTPAFAADMAVKMPVKAPPPPPVPVYSWTGWYVGGNVGYGWGRASVDVNYFAPFVVGSDGCGPAGDDLCIKGSDTVHMNGPIGGIQAGYNWQNGSILAGIEADFQASGQRGTRDFAVNVSTSAGIGTAFISMTERMPWFGTVRGRVGYVANQWLLYATGGLAYGRIEGVDSSAEATGNAPNPNPIWVFSGNGVTKIGWTAGGGTELALGGNWTARFEYLFVDLGSFDTTFTGLQAQSGINFPGGGSASNTVLPGTGTIHSRITDNIVRVGLSYQFH